MEIMKSDGECIYSKNYKFFSEFLSGNMIRKMQQKSLILPAGKDGNRKTLYSHGLEISVVSEMIASIAFSSEKLRNMAIEKYMLSEMLAYAGIVRSSGQPPFGYSANNSIRNWFIDNIEKIKVENKYISELMSERMKEDLINFSGIKMSVRYLLRYTDINLGQVEEFITGLVESESYMSDKSVMYSELNEMNLFSNKKTALSYILEAAAYIVATTSIIDDVVTNSCAISHQILYYLRSNEDFSEDITEEEYQKYCILVNSLERCSSDLKYSVTADRESELIHRWTVLLRNEMCISASESFARNYDEICSGEYKSNLISDSWCRILKPLFRKLCDVLIGSSEYIEASFGTQKIITVLTEQIVNTAVRYDTSERLSFMETKIMSMIPEKCKSVYHSTITGKSEGEKIYLRILMALDYICSMTDSETEEIYRKLH